MLNYFVISHTLYLKTLQMSTLSTPDNRLKACVWQTFSQRYIRYTCISYHIYGFTLVRVVNSSSLQRLALALGQWLFMMTSSNGNISVLLALCAGNSPVTGEFSHKGEWREALMFSLICVWINGWVNNREAGDLRLHRAHYDVILMSVTFALPWRIWVGFTGSC